MSEYNQVDLQIGTEEQFETKKAALSEGVLVGLTDPIHESELDSALQTKLGNIKSIYQHRITMAADTAMRNVIITLINTDITPLTFETFRALLATSSSMNSPFNGLSIIQARGYASGSSGALFWIDLYDATQTTAATTSSPSITIHYKSAYDSDMTNVASREYFESDAFTDNVVEI